MSHCIQYRFYLFSSGLEKINMISYAITFKPSFVTNVVCAYFEVKDSPKIWKCNLVS